MPVGLQANSIAESRSRDEVSSISRVPGRTARIAWSSRTAAASPKTAIGVANVLFDGPAVVFDDHAHLFEVEAEHLP